MESPVAFAFISDRLRQDLNLKRGLSSDPHLTVTLKFSLNGPNDSIFNAFYSYLFMLCPCLVEEGLLQLFIDDILMLENVVLSLGKCVFVTILSQNPVTCIVSSSLWFFVSYNRLATVIVSLYEENCRF